MSDGNADDIPAHPLSGAEYFDRAIGKTHNPAKYGKHEGSHPVTIRRVYEEALIQFPEAADVIAALVFQRSIGINRENYLRQTAFDKAENYEIDG